MPQNAQVIGEWIVYEKQKKWPQALNAYKKAKRSNLQKRSRKRLRA